MSDEYFAQQDDFPTYGGALKAAGATVDAFKQFGSYQGDWWALVTHNGVTGWIHDYYGSCSGCDALEADLGSIGSYLLGGRCGYTEEEWKKYADFGASYLEEIMGHEDAMKLASEHIEWDMEAKSVVDFLEKEWAKLNGGGEA